MMETPHVRSPYARGCVRCGTMSTPRFIRNLCSACYHRAWKHGLPMPPTQPPHRIPKERSTCSMQGCARPVNCKGLCKPCYDRARRDEKGERLLSQHREYYRANREQIRAQQREYEMRNLDRIREYQKEYREINRGRIAAMDAAWYRANVDRKRSYDQQYRLVNAAWCQANAGHAKHTRRAIEAGVAVYEISREELIRIYGSPCFYCGNRPAFVDHVVPLSRGGEHRIGNLVPACQPCNASKGRRLLAEWKLARSC